MYVIAGLGNPGLRYAKTRHNTGFRVIEKLRDKGTFGPEKEKFEAMISKGTAGGQMCLLVRPLTYMNESGRAIRQVLDFYKVEPDHLIVIHDDIDLPAGHLRIRASGSAGGHNGMKSVISCVGTEKFYRVRVGVGAKPDGWDLADYVLSTFSREDEAVMEEAMDQAASAAICLMSEGLSSAMNRYNTKKEKHESNI